MVLIDGYFIFYNICNFIEFLVKINGCIFVFKFILFFQRYIFWFQLKLQGQSGDFIWFSFRDFKIGEIVDQFLQGEEVDVICELVLVCNNIDDS